MAAALPRWPPCGQPAGVLLLLLLAAVAGQEDSLTPPTLERESWWQLRNVSCLQPFQAGCSAIQDKETCLSSRDGSSRTEEQGLKIHGQACVWCGGGACQSNSSSRCGPLDFLLGGEGKAFSTFTAKGNYRVARCGPPLPKYDYSCLKSASGGCGELRDAFSCLSAQDGRNMTSLDGLLVEGQPCVWCGGLPCHIGSEALCEPFDWASSADSKAGFPTRRTLRLASCRNGRPASAMLEGRAVTTPGYFEPPVGSGKLVPYWAPDQPSEADMLCLSPSAGGCSALQDADACLSAKDGSGVPSRGGFKVDGQPCVWCGGGACQSGNLSSLCEPFDFLMMGEGTAFSTFLGRSSFSVASCRGTIRQPPFDYTCLKKAPSTCRALTNASDCLSMKDNSGVATSDGLRVDGEPCVWCGGHSCHSGNFTLCEPFDWALNGEGRAFNQFYGKLTFRIAACTDGKPFPHTYYGPTNVTPGVEGWQWVPLPSVGAESESETTRSDSVAAATPASEASQRPRQPAAASPGVWRLGEDCYEACGEKEGECDWCGAGLACCRRGWPSNPAVCFGVEGYKSPWRHECIAPGRENEAAAAAATQAPTLGARGVPAVEAAAGATAATPAPMPGTAGMPAAEAATAASQGGATAATPAPIPGTAGMPAAEAATAAPTPAPAGASAAEAAAAAAAVAVTVGAGAAGTAAPGPGVEGRGVELPAGGGATPEPTSEHAGGQPAVGANASGTASSTSNTSDIFVNVSALLGSDRHAGGGDTFIWVLLGLFLVMTGCLLFYLYRIGFFKKKKKTTRRKSRGLDDLEDSQAGGDKPLVSDVDSNDSESDSDLFDKLDVNHDGVVTQSEWNKAFGVAPSQPAQMTQTVLQPMVSQVVPASQIVPQIAPTPGVARQFTQYHRGEVAPSPPLPPPASILNVGPLVQSQQRPLVDFVEDTVTVTRLGPNGAPLR